MTSSTRRCSRAAISYMGGSGRPPSPPTSAPPAEPPARSSALPPRTLAVAVLVSRRAPSGVLEGMKSYTEDGALVLADISGFTAFVTATELEHGPPIIAA